LPKKEKALTAIAKKRQQQSQKCKKIFDAFNTELEKVKKQKESEDTHTTGI
jgi:hypothetical protein